MVRLYIDLLLISKIKSYIEVYNMSNNKTQVDKITYEEEIVTNYDSNKPIYVNKNYIDNIEQSLRDLILTIRKLF